jgi:Uncharacterized protein conserved in bacteria
MQTIGERLEEARKKKGISIREAAEATKIRGDYLSKFENNQFDINLTELYVRGFLRTYAQFLRLPVDRILNDYAALGRGEGRPRQPSREIYGRMDVSIASSDERTESTTAESANAPSQTPRTLPPAARRSASATVANLDPALVFKIGKIAAIVLGVALLLWAGFALFNNSSDTPATKTGSPAVTSAANPAEPTITLIASDRVTVTVRRKNPDKSDGELLYQGTLTRGQSQIVPRPGPLYIWANPAEKLEIEVRGRRFPTGFTGSQKLQIE